MANEYTARWFDVFLETQPSEVTSSDVDAVVARLPQPEFSRVLDVCCGPGRHAALLAERGYDVTGIDRDGAAVGRASDRVPGGRFLELDMRDLRSLDGPYDAAMLLWQSYGFFDADGNDQVLADIAALLRPGGRLLLDLFHRTVFEQNQGRISPTRDPRCVAITNTMHGERLTSEIEYVDGSNEAMNFELFTPESIADRAEQFGLTVIEACRRWNADLPPSPEDQRFQVTFERT